MATLDPTSRKNGAPVRDDELYDDRPERRVQTGEWRRFLRSPLTRGILRFNMLLVILLSVIFVLAGANRSDLVRLQGQQTLQEARLAAKLAEARMTAAGTMPQGSAMADLPWQEGRQLMVFNSTGMMVSNAESGRRASEKEAGNLAARLLVGLTGLLIGDGVSMLPATPAEAARNMLAGSAGDTARLTYGTNAGEDYAIATAPVPGPTGQLAGTVAVVAPLSPVKVALAARMERLIGGAILALVLGALLSLLLARMVVGPLNRLATAVEAGEDFSEQRRADRVRLPDMGGRDDEIGRLSRALRQILAALYDRIETNEQFAADVAHELRNPLASLRSAVGTLQVARTEDQRRRLLAVLDQDVRRMDRLVTDISNASRLDAELVREEQQEFELLHMLERLADYSREQTAERGIEFITDLPPEQVWLTGMEARLAQVFVNLIANAISFSDTGDVIRLWVRRRANRVLVVIEDTGPGIPEEALPKVFDRFYSDRDAEEFGENSGLGLSISKQIVEAHGGVIWAENIRPTEDDPLSSPMGARFVVGLPL